MSWVHVDKQLLLTTQATVKTTNPRISIRRQNDTFVLVIDKATLEDVGYYACRVSDCNHTCHPRQFNCSPRRQINVQPPKSQVGFLDVIGRLLQRQRHPSITPPIFPMHNSSAALLLEHGFGK